MYVDFAVVLLLLVAIAVDILSDYQRMTVTVSVNACFLHGTVTRVVHNIIVLV